MISRASSAVSTGKVVKSRHISGVVPKGTSLSRATTTLISQASGSPAASPVLGLAIVALPNETATRAVRTRASGARIRRARLASGGRHIDLERRRKTVGCRKQEAASGQLAVAARPRDEIDVARLADEGLVDVILAVADNNDAGGAGEPLSRALRRIDPAHGFLVLEAPLVAMRLHFAGRAGP